ncbi:hypothetical protein MRX96_004381 [Rhipicephalus microplus]
MPTSRRPPAVSVESLHLGSCRRRRRPAPSSGLSTSSAASGAAASSLHLGVFFDVPAVATGPPRLRPPIVPQGIMTVYLPVLEMLRCPFSGCDGCQARSSVLLRLSTWRSDMKRKHRVLPSQRLYRCVTCDALLTSLSAHHDCPGRASNEPLHPCRYCPIVYNCRLSLTRHSMARHAQEESTPYVPLHDPRQPTVTVLFSMLVK